MSGTAIKELEDDRVHAGGKLVGPAAGPADGGLDQRGQVRSRLKAGTSGSSKSRRRSSSPGQGGCCGDNSLHDTQLTILSPGERVSFPSIHPFQGDRRLA